MIFKKIILFLTIFFITTRLFAADPSNHQLTFYAGMFAPSDSGQRSPYLAVQHLDTELGRESFFGNLQPITGIMVTPDYQGYIYTGLQLNKKIGDNLTLTPSFTPGLYSRGKGKPLYHILQFKSEIQISWKSKNKNTFGFSFNHISNAGIGERNPGANNYMFNYLKKF